MNDGGRAAMVNERRGRQVYMLYRYVPNKKKRVSIASAFSLYTVTTSPAHTHTHTQARAWAHTAHANMPRSEKLKFSTLSYIYMQHLIRPSSSSWIKLWSLGQEKPRVVFRKIKDMATLHIHWLNREKAEKKKKKRLLVDIFRRWWMVHFLFSSFFHCGDDHHQQ